MIIEYLVVAGVIVEALLMIVGGAAVLAAYTPTKKDEVILAKIKNFLNLIAFNVKHAKNKDE